MKVMPYVIGNKNADPSKICVGRVKGMKTIKRFYAGRLLRFAYALPLRLSRELPFEVIAMFRALSVMAVGIMIGR